MNYAALIDEKRTVEPAENAELSREMESLVSPDSLRALCLFSGDLGDRVWR